MRRRVLYVSGTRADYGLMRSVLAEIDRHPALELRIAVTGMHLCEEFGRTRREIEDDGFPYRVLDTAQLEDTRASMAEFVGSVVLKLTAIVRDETPDIILVLGDRGEMLAAAIVGAYLGIPVAHVHGGERSSTVDESARHAITKLAHIHYPATAESAERIVRMGEEPWRVVVVGAPGLDQIVRRESMDGPAGGGECSCRRDSPFILVLQHPVPLEADLAASQMRETLEAVVPLGIHTVVIYPNADAGGRAMIRVIREYERRGLIEGHPNVPHEEFLGLLRAAAVIVGNSSCGIIEAPSLCLPAVNIGSRQADRQRAENVIDAPPERAAIRAAVGRALHDEEFKDRVQRCINPYGDGSTGAAVAAHLASVVIDHRLLQKRMTY